MQSTRRETATTTTEKPAAQAPPAPETPAPEPSQADADAHREKHHPPGQKDDEKKRDVQAGRGPGYQTR